MGKVLVACEYSGRVRDAFTRAGHEAWSCDLIESDELGLHHTGDVLDVVASGWDLLIAFPPCQYLTSANSWRWREIQGLQQEALQFVKQLMDAPIPRICIENPPGAIGTNIRRADQCFHPWQFGHPYVKKTCFWIKGLPLLRATHRDYPPGRTMQAWTKVMHTGHDRSLTFQGIANAMADQWGPLLP